MPTPSTTRPAHDKASSTSPLVIRTRARRAVQTGLLDRADEVAWDENRYPSLYEFGHGDETYRIPREKAAAFLTGLFLGAHASGRTN